jgi:hypothetical protein
MGVCCRTLVKNQVVRGESTLNPMNFFGASQDVKTKLVEMVRLTLLQVGHCRSD